MRFDFRVSAGPVSQASHDSGHGSGCSRAGHIFAARRAAAPEARAQKPGVGGWGLLATLMMIRVMIGRVRSARGCGCGRLQTFKLNFASSNWHAVAAAVAPIQ